MSKISNSQLMFLEYNFILGMLKLFGHGFEGEIQRQKIIFGPFQKDLPFQNESLSQK